MKILGRLFHLDYVGKVEAVSYDGDFPVDRTISVGDSIIQVKLFMTWIQKIHTPSLDLIKASILVRRYTK